MRSQASFHGHPIHPMLIPFPFAFLFGSVAFDIAGRLSGRQDWSGTARTMQSAGIASALVAAVPGLIDYLLTVPPESSAKRRATYHMFSNLGAVALFALARGSRRNGTATPATLSLGLAGAALMSAGGWMGGTLVYRNEIGVDIRHAGAGKWREERLHAEPGRPLVAGTIDELEIDQMKLVHVEGRRIVVARTAEGFRAFDDRCTHRGGSLAGGTLIGNVVQCPWHGSQFDVRTGEVLRGPATTPIGVHEVEPVGAELHLRPGQPADRQIEG